MSNNPSNHKIIFSNTEGLHTSHSFDGLNNMIESIWYAVWASLDAVEDPATLGSALCEGQETLNDPCPFPPLLQDAGFFDGMLLRMFFFGSLNIYWGFTYGMVVPPPKLDFANELLESSAKAKVAIYGNSLFSGRTLLATLETDAEFTATLPDYDSNSGTLKNFELSSIDILNPQANVGVFSFLGLFSGLLISVVDSAVAAFSGTLIDLANNGIRGFLDSTPIKVPNVPQFPTKTQNVTITLTNPTISGVASGPSSSGFLSITSGISVDVVGSVAAKSLFDNTIYKNRSYKTTYDWVLESKDPDTLFSYSFYDPVAGDMEIYSLRWEKSKSRVEISRNGTEDWLPADPPIL